jgi:hypothetical protein
MVRAHMSQRMALAGCAVIEQRQIAVKVVGQRNGEKQ